MECQMNLLEVFHEWKKQCRKPGLHYWHSKTLSRKGKYYFYKSGIVGTEYYCGTHFCEDLLDDWMLFAPEDIEYKGFIADARYVSGPHAPHQIYA